MKKPVQIFNSIRVKNKPRVIKISDCITVTIKGDATADDPAELMLYDGIGRDPWDETGITAGDFKKALDTVKGRSLDIRINSLGGDVFEGLAIKAMLDEWPQKVRAKIDGIAASTASFIPMGADEIEMAKDAQMFIHDAWGICQGNAEDMAKTAAQLDSTSDGIASMYAERNGKSVAEMRAFMKDETLMNAAKCKELGLCDVISGAAAVRNFTDIEISGMKAKLQTLHATTNSVSDKTQAGKQNQPTQNIMNRIQMLALLKKHGITPPDNETDVQILARIENLTVTAPVTPPVTPPANEVEALRLQVVALNKVNDQARRLGISAKVKVAISDDKFPLAQEADLIEIGMENEARLDKMILNQPSAPVGSQNLQVSTLEVPHGGQVDVKNLKEHFMDLGPRFSAHFLGPQNADKELDKHALKAFAANAHTRTRDYRKHRDQLIAAYDTLVTAKNTNSIDSNLQRVVLLQEMMEEYAIQVAPLAAFSMVHNNVPLEGLDTVGVPFFPLQTEASTSWVAATGYTFNDSNSQIRQVKVGGGGGGGTGATANMAYDRLFQGLQFDSYTLRRQPFFNAAKLNKQNANKLGVDIFAQIVSRVINPTNYGATVDATPASAFSSSDIALLYGVATSAQWPMSDRTLILDHTYNVSLLQDPTFKQYLAYGSTDPILEAKIKQAYGFDKILVVPNLTSYFNATWGGLAAGANPVTGWINHLYAMLVATSPIMPAPEVRTLLSRYDVIADDRTGASFEYREMASAQLDQAQFVVECSFGASLGVASSLKRITNA